MIFDAFLACQMMQFTLDDTLCRLIFQVHFFAPIEHPPDLEHLYWWAEHPILIWNILSWFGTPYYDFQHQSWFRTPFHWKIAQNEVKNSEFNYSIKTGIVNTKYSYSTTSLYPLWLIQEFFFILNLHKQKFTLCSFLDLCPNAGTPFNWKIALNEVKNSEFNYSIKTGIVNTKYSYLTASLYPLWLIQGVFFSF